MRKLHAIAISAAAALAAPLPALADFGPRAAAPQPESPRVAELVVLEDARVLDERVASGIHSGGDNPSDIALADEVAAALALDPRLDGATVTVVAEDGNVSLTGSAEEAAQAGIAQQIARNVEGVETVSGTLEQEGA